MTGAAGRQARGAAETADGRRGPARRGPWRGLLLPAVIVVVLAATVSVVAWAIFDSQADDLRADSASALQGLWGAQSRQISALLEDERHDTALLARAPDVVRPLRHHVASGRERPPLRVLRQALALYRDAHGYAAMAVLDADLDVVAVSPPGHLDVADGGLTARQRRLVREALRERRPAFSDLYLTRGGTVVMEFAASIEGGTGAGSLPLGVLLVEHDAEEVLFPILGDWPRSLRTGESVLAEARGDELILLNPLQLGDREPLSLTRPLSAEDLPAAQAHRGSQGVVRGVDYRGEPVLASVGRIAGTPWYLVAKQDLAVIEEPIRGRALSTLAWMVAVVVLAGAVLLFYLRSREASSLRELVAAERELAGLSQRFEATVMASPLAIVALDLDRRVRLWNPAAAGMFGWTADEVIGEPAPFIPPDMQERAADLERRLVAGEQFAGLDMPSICKDGRRLHTSLSLALTRDEDGLPGHVIAVLEDFTERRATIVRLARLTRLYEVLSAVTEAIPRVREPDRLYEEVCRIAVSLGGFQLAWVGRRRRGAPVRALACAGPDGVLDDLVIDTRLPEGELSIIGTALVRGRSDSCGDVRVDPRMTPYRAHAETYGLRSMAAVPIVVAGRTEAALAIYSSEPGRFDAEEVSLLERLAADVGFAIEAAGKERARATAERKLEALNAGLEARVRERTDELREANAELEAFSYSVSHDLRAPLRALDGFSLALLEDHADKLDDEGVGHLGRIRAASQRMARLIDDLLALSRVVRREMSRETVDLSAMARAIGRDLAAEDAGRHVRLEVAAGMRVEGDPHLIEVVLRNLLGNAWKFTSRAENACVEVGIDEREGERAFFVRDNGAGFDPRYGDQLFAPFQRLHREDEFPGTGIGLATVQRIVRRHGGRVWAEGAPGKGATVWFTVGPGGESA